MYLRLPYQLLPRAHAALILLAALSLRGGAPAQEPTRYLAFQLFTGGVPGDPADVARLRSLDDLRSSVVDLRDRIGARGTDGRKLGVVLGPIAFDHTDDESRRMIAGTFDIALATGVAVGFHIDDQMFWGRRLSALRSARNIEWLDWKGTPNTGRRLDWSSTPLKIAPQLCLNSRDVRAAVALRGALIGQEVAKGIARLHAAHRDDLFIGVIAGWETQIGRDFDTGKYLGYCALTNAGYSAARPPPDLDSARIRIVADFVSLWAQSLTDAGVPRGKVFSHVAFMSEPMYKLAERVAPSRLTGPYLQLVNFSPPSTAFCSTCMPGLSTYPQPGLLDQWQGEREKHGNPSWASAEGTSLDPGSVEHGGAAMDMERYLGNMFNHGAVLVNVFGWGVGDAQNPFRRIAESESAIAAYRKFLRGEQMAEAPWPAPQIPPAGLEAKVHRVQAELPGWVEKHGPARVQDAASRLDRAMRSEHFEEASEAADAVLRTIEPTRQ